MSRAMRSWKGLGAGGVVGMVSLVTAAGVGTGEGAATSAGSPAATASAVVVGNRPGPFPRSELIAYSRTSRAPGVGSQIWLMGGDGRQQREASHTPPGASDASPSFSLAIALVVWQRTQAGRSQLLVGDAFGDTPSVLISPSSGARDPSISPKADVVFSTGAPADCDLWVVNYRFGSVPRRLSDHSGAPGCDTEPVWSPSGLQIAFRRTVTDAAGHPLRSAVMVLNASGGAAHPAPLGATPVEAFAWGPGTQLLLVTAGRQPALEAVDVRSGKARVLLRNSRLTGTPTWAPQAARVAFAERQSDGSTDLFSAAPNGHDVVRLTHTPGISEDHPSWAYPSNQGSEPGPGVHARSVASGRRRRR